MFSVCAVLYGDYPQLAARLLNSLKLFEHVRDVRLGLNAVSDVSRQLVTNWASRTSKSCPVYVFEDAQKRNLGKYPVMRQMFAYRPLARKIMWFDDDSYLSDDVDDSWWQAVRQAVNRFTQIGVIHTIMQRGSQYQVIQQQPWYNSKIINSKHRFRFITGGWWVIDSEFVKQWDYPFPSLYHNGGDSILGELLRQQSKKMDNFYQARCGCESCLGKAKIQNLPVVHINVGGRKGRRGIGVQDEKYVWDDGNAFPSLEHQNFDMRVYSYGV